jgi:ZIP family zinc transporter
MPEKAKIAARTLLGEDRTAVLQRLAAFTVLAALFGAAGGFARIAGAFAGNPVIGPALLATALTAAATGLGAVPMLAVRSLSAPARDALLGFGAGVMLAASAFSLILPGLAAGEALTGSRWAAGGIVAAGVLAGGLAIAALDRWLPHAHVAQDARRVWLFVSAIALHNLPEGLAVGVGFGQADPAQAWPLAIGIAVQNLPEGLVVAAALAGIGYARGTAVAIAAATGLAEPLGGLFGAGIFGISQAALPWGLAFAAGAMLFVVSHEIIPESHRRGHESRATLGVMAGFVAMMLLDTGLAV